MSILQILVCAGTDPTNGAGLGADILTLSSLGAHPLGIVTAVTAQDTFGVHAVDVLQEEQIRRQWNVLVQDANPSAVKWGMLGSSGNLFALVECVNQLPNDVPVIIDPVLASGRGDVLATEALCAAYMDMKISKKRVIFTPNYIEFLSLMKCSHDEPISKNLINLFFERQNAIEWLLIKGTHANTEFIRHQAWGRNGEYYEINCSRLAGEFHGSGCTFASALALFLGKRASFLEAFKRAHGYVLKSIQNAYSVGHGQKIPNRLM